MKKKILIFSLILFFLLILSGLIYLVFFEKKNGKKYNSQINIKKNKKTPKKQIIKAKNIRTKTIKIIKKKQKEEKDSNQINIFSHFFLEKTFQNFKVPKGKDAVILEYQKKILNNNYEIKKIRFENNFLEKIFIKAISEKIDFVNLLVIFKYGENIPRFKIKIAFAKYPKIFIEKEYQIEKNSI